jgi:hypothetical protein
MFYQIEIFLTSTMERPFCPNFHVTYLPFVYKKSLLVCEFVVLHPLLMTAPTNFQTEILSSDCLLCWREILTLFFYIEASWLFYLLRSWNLETSGLLDHSEISRTECWRMNRTFFCRARDTRLRMSELAEEIASTTTGLGTLIHIIFFFPRHNFRSAFSKTLLLYLLQIIYYRLAYLPHCMNGLQNICY